MARDNDFNLDPLTKEPGAHPVGTGVGAALGGAAAPGHADGPARLAVHLRGAGPAPARGGEPHDPALRRHVPERGTVELANGRYFQLHRLDGEPDAAIRAAYAGPLLVIPRVGEVRHGGETLRPGECGQAASIADLAFDAAGLCLIARPK